LGRLFGPLAIPDNSLYFVGNLFATWPVYFVMLLLPLLMLLLHFAGSFQLGPNAFSVQTQTQTEPEAEAETDGAAADNHNSVGHGYGQNTARKIKDGVGLLMGKSCS